MPRAKARTKSEPNMFRFRGCFGLLVVWAQWARFQGYVGVVPASAQVAWDSRLQASASAACSGIVDTSLDVVGASRRQATTKTPATFDGVASPNQT